MSKENLEQFMSKVADSEELQAKIGEEIDAEALIALGAECGCEFTAEELQESAELSDEELGTLAGGANNYPTFLHKKWHKAKFGAANLYGTTSGGTQRVDETGNAERKHDKIVDKDQFGH